MDEYGRKSEGESRVLRELYDKYSHLQVAFERAKASPVRLEKLKNQVESPYILNNIKKHKLVPAYTPTGPLRRAPDRNAFLEREAQDRKDAIKYQIQRDRPFFVDSEKLKKMNNDRGFDR